MNKIKISHSQTPLDELSALLKTDMNQVNALILKRMHSDIPLIPQLATYLIASGGKRIRPLLTIASARLFDGQTQRPFTLAAAVEFIHTATLLHDDVVDSSMQRRGKASANIVFGNEASVLVGDFLFARAFELMVEDGSLEVLKILSNASAVISEGEILQLSLQHNLETSLDQYKQVIAAKTAALFKASTEVGAVVTKQNENIQTAIAAYGHNLGMAFQIADDILDYAGNAQTIGKDLFDDFKEGKMSAPVIFALEEFDDSNRALWESVFGQNILDHKNPESEIQKAITALQKTNALNRTRSLGQIYVDKALENLNELPNTPLKEILKNLAEFSLSRAL